MNAIILTLLLLAATDDMTNCPMHAQHVAERGDKVMGFSHDKTTHDFRSLADGGSIEARARDAKDAESIAAIRAHMKTIAKDFAAGNFEKPREIHGRAPDGVEVMLKSAIDYRYEEVENGARVRIVTTDARAIAAIHAFLDFQNTEHNPERDAAHARHGGEQ